MIGDDDKIVNFIYHCNLLKTRNKLLHKSRQDKSCARTTNSISSYCHIYERSTKITGDYLRQILNIDSLSKLIILQITSCVLCCQGNVIYSYNIQKIKTNIYRIFKLTKIECFIIHR